MKALAQAHIQELNEKLKELQGVKATLEHLVHCCEGDDRPECPIIQTLESGVEVGAVHGRHNGQPRAGRHPGKRRGGAASRA